ncbi:hypothetical protein [Angustibacter luteus]
MHSALTAPYAAEVVASRLIEAQRRHHDTGRRPRRRWIRRGLPR